MESQESGEFGDANPRLPLREEELATEFYRKHFARAVTDPEPPVTKLAVPYTDLQSLAFYQRGFDVVHAAGEIWSGYTHFFNFDRVPPILKRNEWADLELILMKDYDVNVDAVSIRLSYQEDWSQRWNPEESFLYNVNTLTNFFRATVCRSFRKIELDDIMAKLIKIKIGAEFSYVFGRYDFDEPVRTIPDSILDAMQNLLRAYRAYVGFVFENRARSQFVKQLILHYEISGTYEQQLRQYEDTQDFDRDARTPRDITVTQRYQMPLTEDELDAWLENFDDDPLLSAAEETTIMVRSPFGFAVKK